MVHFLEPLCAPLPDLLEGEEACIARTQDRAEIVVESKRLLERERKKERKKERKTERETERETEKEPALLPVVKCRC